jgi:hypothetical protein
MDLDPAKGNDRAIVVDVASTFRWTGSLGNTGAYGEAAV